MTLCILGGDRVADFGVIFGLNSTSMYDILNDNVSIIHRVIHLFGDCTLKAVSLMLPPNFIYLEEDETHS